MQIIECLDNEMARWNEIVKNTQNEHVKFDYDNDIIALEKLIKRFKIKAQNIYGDNIVELAHWTRGVSL